MASVRQTTGVGSGVPVSLSLAETRRLAIASQGFGARREASSHTHVRKLLDHVHQFQIDSVNVLVRAHYVPAYARLGPYPMPALDELAYKRRELFEYWGHAACLLPMRLYPLLRYRMYTERTLDFLKTERGAYTQAILDEVGARGALSACELRDPGKGKGSWWGWGSGRSALEHLYDAGLLAIAGRRGFERLYDLPERVIPKAVRETSSPPREESMKQLICLGAKACGVGTLADICGYFYVDGWHDRRPEIPWWIREAGDKKSRPKPIAKRLVAELVEEGRLLPARVEGWKEPAYLHPEAMAPRRIHARALVTPFDSLVWERARIERLFGMKYTIEIYTPEPKRIYGYYVCPFLLGDTLVARCDLKADRQRSTLLVRAAHLEPGQKAPALAPELAAELRLMQSWLQLEHLEVTPRGDLAPALLTMV